MIWNSGTNERISVLEGHISRVLHLAVSPDGESIATAAADETLKFWKVFPKQTIGEEVEKAPDLLQLR
jgi:WD40 repeat protein